MRGVVWHPPGQVDNAVQDLIEMKATGVQVVRTALVNDETIYSVADSLGLQFYQDFPFEYIPAQELADTLQYATQVLQEALWWAENHPSARYFGLSIHNDTSDQKACEFLDELTRSARQMTQHPVGFYAVTSFIEDEQCAGSVDVSFLDLLDEKAPLQIAARWQKAHPNQRVSIGAIGSWVRELEEGDLDGYELQHSPAYQARYLETNLNALLHQEAGLDAVFVYSWRDRRLTIPSSAQDLSFPFRHTYGLKTVRNEARPSLAVVEGFFTGKQKVFAFPVGRPSGQSVPWIIILGWVNIALLGVGFANFPRFKPTVRRYFTAHAFYRDSVSEGRELLFGPNALLLVIVMLAFGITGAVILDAVRSTTAFAVLVRWLPESVGMTLIALLAKPLILIVVLASGFGLGATIWTSILSAASTRSRRTLLPGQTFILVVWPQWPLLSTMIAAIALGTMETSQAPRLALALFFFTAIILLASSIRVLVDYMAIVRTNWVQRLIAWLSNPALLLAVFGVYVFVQYSSKFSFFWHLITRI